ncbi:Son of sevenless [Quillaja saponaria]|uniref:Son of sevenless n=1 Tax=Quillaja saponaria TaxID=32244 RepID=A0AAD7PFN9_QUISA|nr:Son of sevenless [Quillaja saponaria]
MPPLPFKALEFSVAELGLAFSDLGFHLELCVIVQVDEFRITLIEMELTSGSSPRNRSDHLIKEGSEETQLQCLELESSDHGFRYNNNHIQSMSALDILRETVRILRYNCSGFMAIAALLICPVSAVLLSNVLVDQSIVKTLSIRLMLVAKSSGLPLRPLIKHSCQRFAEMSVSSAMCFPLFATLSLLSKAAVVYSVDCTYSRKMFDLSKFCVIIAKFWRRILSTYMWACAVIVGCITLFFVLLVAVCSAFAVTGFSADLIVYAAMIVGLAFSVIFANAIIICNIGIVISVLEDVSGPQALLRSSILIRGQTQVGLLIYLGSTIGMAFVEGLFEHRVKTLSYGDGSSRMWEGPLLVIMYSFVVLIDSMMSAVFYFSCRSICMEASNGEGNSILETMAFSAESMGIQ